MQRRAIVLLNKIPIGMLEKNPNGYIFRYHDEYFINQKNKAISITLPKTKQEHFSKILFPFFFNMLSEGVNRQLQCRQYKIDEDDYFSLLLATGSEETVGAVSVQSLNE